MAEGQDLALRVALATLTVAITFAAYAMTTVDLRLWCH